MKIRVMMIDHDVNHLEAVKKYFCSSSSIEVVKIISKKEEALASLNDDYDILIINMLLSGLDSIAILAKMRELKIDKPIVATAEFMSQDMMDGLTIYNPNYFIKKPYSLETLEKVILAVSNKTNKINKDIKVQITDMLHHLGIPSHIKGFQYIRDSVELVYNDRKMSSITKRLYPTIAENYETTSSRVERAIRHAIEVSWMRGDYDYMNELFGSSVDFDRDHPTNSEFIATLADRLKLLT